MALYILCQGSSMEDIIIGEVTKLAMIKISNAAKMYKNFILIWFGFLCYRAVYCCPFTEFEMLSEIVPFFFSKLIQIVPLNFSFQKVRRSFVRK